MMARISEDIVAVWAERIRPLDTEFVRHDYRRGEFSRSDVCKDVNKRYRWDLFWAAGGCRLLDMVGHDVTDAHIDTALRKIVRTL